MDALKKEFESKKRDSEVMKAFGVRLRGQFTSNKAYRRPKELEWLESLRQYKGLYDPDVRLDPMASKVYPKITRSKVNIVLSRLHEMLFPEIDKNWEIMPTPDPRMAKEQVKQIAMSLIEQDPNTGEVVMPTADDLQMAITKYAKDTCAKMSMVIDDQFVEMDYPEETKKVLRSGLMYGTGVLKGPMIGKRTKRRWKPVTTKDGWDYEEELQTEDVPDLQFVRLWDWYPDMTTTEIDKIEGSFERHVMTKHDLRQLCKRSDFYDDMIIEYLKDHPDGDYVPLNWEVDLQVIEVEAGSGSSTNRTTGVSSSASTDERNRSTYRQFGKKYEVLEFWGYIDGSDLATCGVDIEDPELEYAANIWLLGSIPIKAILYPEALDQYKVFYYEKDETSIFGEGLGRIMRHSQLAIAAGARMVLDNAACVAGPQIEVNWSLMTQGTDLNSFYPRKIWYRKGTGIDAQYPALRVYNIDSHVDELLKIVDAFKQFGDEETTLPTWMIGQMVNNETAQATSGRMATITVSIKDVVKNFDTFTEHIIRDMYAWNMEFNPRQDIKGDYTCKARGVSSLVMKEVRMQALDQLTSTMTEREWDYIPEREFLAEKFKAHDLPIQLRSEEEVAKIRQDRENSKQAQMAIEMGMAEIAYKKAQTMAQLTKAKKSNVEAISESSGGEDPRLAEADLAIKGKEVEAKDKDIQRQDESHVVDMQTKMDTHATKKAIDQTTAAHKIAIAEKQAEHGMSLEEKKAEQDRKLAEGKAKDDSASKKVMTKASASAKIIAAKKKPAAKPATKKK